MLIFMSGYRAGEPYCFIKPAPVLLTKEIAGWVAEFVPTGMLVWSKNYSRALLALRSEIMHRCKRLSDMPLMELSEEQENELRTFKEFLRPVIFLTNQAARL